MMNAKIIFLPNNGLAPRLFLVYSLSANFLEIIENKSNIVSNYSIRDIHPLDCKIILEKVLEDSSYLKTMIDKQYELRNWYTLEDGTETDEPDFSKKIISTTFRLVF